MRVSTVLRLEEKIMAEYVIGLQGYVYVEADSDDEAIEKALTEIPNEIEAQILEIHYGQEG